MFIQIPSAPIFAQLAGLPVATIRPMSNITPCLLVQFAAVHIRAANDACR